MISVTLLLWTFGIILFACYYIRHHNKNHNFKKQPQGKNIPGPWRMPLLGNLHQLSVRKETELHELFDQWSKEYGDIYRVDFATTTNIVISDPKLVKQAFSDSTFSGRPDLTLFDCILDGKAHGVINTEGEHWEELRRFTFRQLREFGLGKSSSEDAIMVEVNELLDRISEFGQSPVNNVKKLFFYAIVNTFWRSVCGKRYAQDDEKLIKMTQTANETFNNLFEKTPLTVFIPWAAKLFPNLSGYQKIREQIIILAKFFWEPIEQHMQSHDKNQRTQKDFIDIAIGKIRETTNPNSAFYGKLGYENLCATIGDLYFAGTDTTSTTLSWMILYLSKFPWVQEKLQREIQEVTGNNSRQVSVLDRPKMQYMEAVIAETLRYSSVLPMGVAHRAVKDALVGGVEVKEGWLLCPNLHFIHFRQDLWEAPQKFWPERFLHQGAFRWPPNLIPFSQGRRKCLGERLASQNIFIFAANLFQRFRVRLDPNGPDPGLRPKVGILLNTPPFSVIFEERP